MIVDCSDIQINKIEAKNQFEIQILDFFKSWFSQSDFMSVKTSGSTGKPKIFDVEKSKMRHSAKMTCDFLNLKPHDTALLCLPVEYISGKMLLVRSIERQLRVTITEPSLNPLANIDKSIDFSAMTPLQVENSLDKLHLIQKLIIGGAAVSESLKSKLSTTNTEIYETYGMSETLSHIALKMIRPQSEDYFTCFDGITISTDDRGCLKIDAPQLSEEILQTNDIVDIISHNQFRFIGRTDNVINSGGVKIFPEALEALVKQSISNEIVFIGLDDDMLGQKLILVVEGESNDKINQQLSTVNYDIKAHRPKEIIYIEKIPRTDNGKVSRIQLKNLLNNKNSD
ncbi:AMP-binding protein [Chryseobacterium sp. T1]